MLAPGTHEVAFRLDGFGVNPSGLEITNVELGLVQVADPDDYNVAPSAGIGGGVDPNLPQSVAPGETASFAVASNQGFVPDLTVEGTCPEGEWNGNTWTTGTIFSDCTVIFGFSPTDTDGDSIPDATDNCPSDSNPSQDDQDSDGYGDACDNCSAVANGSLIPDAGAGVQRDTDGDGFGDVCDCDFNNDGGCGQPDYSLFLSCFNQLAPEGSACELYDMNGDGGVGQPDYSLFISGFGGQPGPSGRQP